MKCNYCDLELKFKQAIGVLPAGITGHLVLRCHSCYRYVRAAMGKVHRVPNKHRGPPVFDVNSKLATAIHHSGIGPTQANNFITALNLPFVSSGLFKKRSDEVSDTLQRVARTSLDKALSKEVEMTVNAPRNSPHGYPPHATTEHVEGSVALVDETCLHDGIIHPTALVNLPHGYPPHATTEHVKGSVALADEACLQDGIIHPTALGNLPLGYPSHATTEHVKGSVALVDETCLQDGNMYPTAPRNPPLGYPPHATTEHVKGSVALADEACLQDGNMYPNTPRNPLHAYPSHATTEHVKGSVALANEACLQDGIIHPTALVNLPHGYPPHATTEHVKGSVALADEACLQDGNMYPTAPRNPPLGYPPHATTEHVKGSVALVDEACLQDRNIYPNAPRNLPHGYPPHATTEHVKGSVALMDETCQKQWSQHSYYSPSDGNPDFISSAPDIHVAGIIASADGAYQKRGSGKSHNSLSGTATLIGKRTGKVIAATSRSKRCRTCTLAKKRKVTPRKHKCVKNWTGSAKSMEADMVVEMLKDVKERNATVTTLIGDDDTTGFQRARDEVFKEMEKVSDSNHVKKNISNQLFKLKGNFKEMSVKTINAIIKSFEYMLAQSKGSTDLIKKNMDSVVLHQFGTHENCGNWCRMKSDGSKKHKNLPWGADLKNEQLKEDLLKIFRKLDVQKLSKLDSTNANESFNNILRSKAPKDKHYSESGSLQNRLAVAVSQKNEGYGYISKVNEDLGLSPGNATTMCARLRDKDVERKRKVAKTKKFKLRRLQLKSERSLETRSAEVREGDTYSSNIMDGTNEPDIRRIPEIGSKPKYVYFDLETTGLARTSSITQISAVYGEVVFNEFVTPTQPISAEAEAVTGIRFDSSTNQMTQYGTVVEHNHIMNVLLNFIDFLRPLKENIVLVAHNCRNFDCIILYNQLVLQSLWKYFCEFVIGFSDTLPFFKRIHPEFQNYKQTTLAVKLLHEKYSAHDALEDCNMLQKLVKETSSEGMLFDTFFFSVSQITGHGVEHASCTIEYLCAKKVLSKAIAKKVLASSLTYDCLKLAFERDGYDGVHALLSERDAVTGKPRVSKCQKVVKKLVDYFAQ